MVARGDLGVEGFTQQVPLYQKRIIAKANEKGKPGYYSNTHVRIYDEQS